MALMFRRGLAMPIWAIGACAVALSTGRPYVFALLGIAAIGCTMSALMRSLHPSRRRAEVLPAGDGEPAATAAIVITRGTRIRTLAEWTEERRRNADDAADLVRMDDDGGGRVAARVV